MEISKSSGVVLRVSVRKALKGLAHAAADRDSRANTRICAKYGGGEAGLTKNLFLFHTQHLTYIFFVVENFLKYDQLV